MCALESTCIYNHSFRPSHTSGLIIYRLTFLTPFKQLMYLTYCPFIEIGQRLGTTQADVTLLTIGSTFRIRYSLKVVLGGRQAWLIFCNAGKLSILQFSLFLCIFLLSKISSIVFRCLFFFSNYSFTWFSLMLKKSVKPSEYCRTLGGKQAGATSSCESYCTHNTFAWKPMLC